jgi:hypothetical protein
MAIDAGTLLTGSSVQSREAVTTVFAPQLSQNVSPMGYATAKSFIE